MAIVNPADIKPYAEIPAEERKLAEDLIFNRDPDALAYLITYFESVEDTGADESAEKEALDSLTPEERLHWAVLHRHKAGVEADIDAILNRDTSRPKGETAVEILNEVPCPP